MTDIQHDTATHRFITRVDGHEAGLEYDLEDRTMVVTHTLVPEAISGRGIAGALTRAAFEHARAEGMSVRPECPYAAAWAERHPEYAALLD